ncbi:hypothetical protein ACFX2B_007703 [Malus domestica]
MDPYFQQRLRDEVIYLHSLWYQGPPSSSSNPNPRLHQPNPYPNPNPNPNPYNRPRPRRNVTNPSQPDPLPQSGHQGPSSSSSKRKRNRNSRHERERPAKKNPSQPDPLPPHSGPPWPCPSPARDSAPGSSTQWPAMPAKPNSAAVAQPPSPEEQARLAALKLQHGALDFCRGLFSGNDGSDGEESEAEESEDGEDYWVENGETEEYKVLLNLFVERTELRRYYEVNYENGEFCCLVCDVLGKKKRVRSCVGLVQHSISITNTKKKRVHRAFAQVVCKVLGWDFDRLPTIVLKGERLGLSLENQGQEQGEAAVNAGSSEGVLVSVEDNVALENAMEAEIALEDNVASENAVEDNVAPKDAMEDDVAPGDTMEDNVVTENAREDNLAAKNAVEDNLVTKNAMEDNLPAEKAMEIENAVENNVVAENAVEGNVATENSVEEIVTAENADEDIWFAEANALCNEVMDCQKSFAGDYTNESTESMDKGISEMEANKETVDTWGTDQTLVSKNEWPCKESSISSSTVLGWLTFTSPPASATCSIPVEEQARSAEARIQQKALKECLDFFSEKDGSYSDEDNSEDDEEGDLMDEDGCEENELKFFSRIFTEDGELRSFYEKNYEGGEFCCLVCCALMKKGWKRFKGGVALLQHCNAILKTKKKAAHRAYGQVICKLLGWDIGQPPPTIGSMDKTRGEPLSESDNLPGEVEENVDNDKDNMVVSNENVDCMSGYNRELVSNEESDVAHSNGTSKTPEMQGVPEENVVVSNEHMDSISGYNRETVPKEESDGAHGDGTFTVPGLRVSLNSVVHSSTKSGESQAEPNKNVDGRSEGLNVFMENLETVVMLT